MLTHMSSLRYIPFPVPYEYHMLNNYSTDLQTVYTEQVCSTNNLKNVVINYNIILIVPKIYHYHLQP